MREEAASPSGLIGGAIPASPWIFALLVGFLLLLLVDVLRDRHARKRRLGDSSGAGETGRTNDEDNPGPLP